MEDNYLGNLKINDYAILTGRSVSTFTREFKRLYGITPNKWLIKKRLKKAHDLLNDTNMNVTQVSMEVGYENISHFIKAYKEVYGVTPKLTKNITND
jgi:transcriptional regulator GlxA family with amidase domain